MDLVDIYRGNGYTYMLTLLGKYLKNKRKKRKGARYFMIGNNPLTENIRDYAQLWGEPTIKNFRLDDPSYFK